MPCHDCGFALLSHHDDDVGAATWMPTRGTRIAVTMEPIDDEQAGDFVEFYTRRGCPISARLARQLQRRRLPMRYHDIWADERDAAFVRSVARGNETVPTVLIGDTALVAPSVRQVFAVLIDQAPHLLPVDDEPRDAGLIRLVRTFTRRPHTNGDDQAR